MKTTVYAVRNQAGQRVSYRYSSKHEAEDLQAAMSRRNPAEQYSVYRTTQDLPRGRVARWRTDDL